MTHSIHSIVQKYTLAATCAAGTEELVTDEILSCGGDAPESGRGVVSWSGNLESGYRACLWSRYASRILLEIARFPVVDEDSLYDGALQVDWSTHLDVVTTFAVDCTVSGKDTSLHSRFAALRVKDAIVDQFRSAIGERPSVDTDRPGVRVNVLVQDDQAIVAIDLSGESLHRRGYRVEGTMAPLKENLGAAIVGYSGWLEMADQTTALIDPMCGSGTLLIEAALIYGDSAPGLFRNYFGFLGWREHDPELWSRLVDEAMAREELGNEKEWPVIIGYDSDPKTVSAARRNIVKAGLDERIQIKQAELATLRPPAAKGLLLSNLPYGERLSEVEEVTYLYRGLGRIAREWFIGWRLGVFISSPELTDSFRLSWQHKHRLYNGALQCRLLVTTVDEPMASGFKWQINPEPPAGEGVDFANRLRKNLKKTLKWAAREGISCFRVYDRDLSEYNVSIDLYEKWVQVQEYAPPESVDPQRASSRFQVVLRVVRETLGIRADRVFIKRRVRQRGKSQYQKKSSRKKMFEVREGQCSLLVNFTDYLDTGLFLDHRPTRLRIFREAGGKRFLNLYGYTGTASVHAAIGGAASTTTVDLSATYLAWTRMNLALNGLDTITNRTECSDCQQWLEQDKAKYDLIFIDPPTFSNTKKDKRVFDVQRDHNRLITMAMQRLEDDGLMLFSTNFKKFRLDTELTENYLVKDVGRTSVPFDFSRSAHIHKCWELRKRPV